MAAQYPTHQRIARLVLAAPKGLLGALPADSDDEDTDAWECLRLAAKGGREATSIWGRPILVIAGLSSSAGCIRLLPGDKIEADGTLLAALEGGES